MGWIGMRVGMGMSYVACLTPTRQERGTPPLEVFSDIPAPSLYALAVCVYGTGFGEIFRSETRGTYGYLSRQASPIDQTRPCQSASKDGD